MADLRNATGETINLVGVHGGRLVYEAVLEGGYALRKPAVARPGRRRALQRAGQGRAGLVAPAALCDVLLGPEPFQRFNERTITTRRDLDRELAVTRERGFALDEEENETGLSCVAAADLRHRRPAGLGDLGVRAHRPDAPAGSG